MILIIDNYDSFTFNLYQLIGEINPDIKVVRNDKLTIEDIRAMQPDHIIISPGPGNPKQAGICLEVIRQLAGEFPILGVCLGHQTIGEAFGGNVVHAPEIVHGKADKMYLEAASLPECLEVTAKTAKDEIMALQHKTLPVYGVQFHPESIMTPQGRTILKNFLSL